MKLPRFLSNRGLCYKGIPGRELYGWRAFWAIVRSLLFIRQRLPCELHQGHYEDELDTTTAAKKLNVPVPPLMCSRCWVELCGLHKEQREEVWNETRV